ncbi:MAG: hypothetical protein JWN77_3343, partial [Frankiales bacterium]|nr:hypothetical protein [Frankiales bacterium]
MTHALTRVSVVRSGAPDGPLLAYLARAGWTVTDGLDGD